MNDDIHIFPFCLQSYVGGLLYALGKLRDAGMGGGSVAQEIRGRLNELSLPDPKT